MTFAPVGIRCPDHCERGCAQAEPVPHRAHGPAAGQIARAAPATIALVVINIVVYVITAAQGHGINTPGGKLFNDWALVGCARRSGRLVAARDRDVPPCGRAPPGLQHVRALLARIGRRAGNRDAATTSCSISSPVSRARQERSCSAARWQRRSAPRAPFSALWARCSFSSIEPPAHCRSGDDVDRINLAITFAIPGISKGGHLGGLIGGILIALALDEGRRRRIPDSGSPLVVAVAVGSVLVAYLRVSSYGPYLGSN